MCKCKKVSGTKMQNKNVGTKVSRTKIVEGLSDMW